MDVDRVTEMQKILAASDMFQLLSISLQLPNKELVRGLIEGSIAEDVAAILYELGFDPKISQKIDQALQTIQMRTDGKEGLFSELRREYTRLFTNPTRVEIPVYETLFRQATEVTGASPVLFISPTALDAERCYKKAGLKMSNEVNESGDHMATEMEFMMYLYQRKAEATQVGDLVELAKRNAEIEEFYQLHIKHWAVAFFEKCQICSKSKFYSIIGEMGSVFLRSEFGCS